MKRIILIMLCSVVFFGGCSTFEKSKTGLERSPCASIEIKGAFFL
jgi:hypothetical protein